MHVLLQPSTHRVDVNLAASGDLLLQVEIGPQKTAEHIYAELNFHLNFAYCFRILDQATDVAHLSKEQIQKIEGPLSVVKLYERRSWDFGVHAVLGAMDTLRGSSNLSCIKRQLGDSVHLLPAHPTFLYSALFASTRLHGYMTQARVMMMYLTFMQDDPCDLHELMQRSSALDSDAAIQKLIEWHNSKLVHLPRQRFEALAKEYGMDFRTG